MNQFSPLNDTRFNRCIDKQSQRNLFLKSKEYLNVDPIDSYLFFIQSMGLVTEQPKPQVHLRPRPRPPPRPRSHPQQTQPRKVRFDLKPQPLTPPPTQTKPLTQPRPSLILQVEQRISSSSSSSSSPPSSLPPSPSLLSLQQPQPQRLKVRLSIKQFQPPTTKNIPDTNSPLKINFVEVDNHKHRTIGPMEPPQGFPTFSEPGFYNESTPPISSPKPPPPSSPQLLLLPPPPPPPPPIHEVKYDLFNPVNQEISDLLSDSFLGKTVTTKNPFDYSRLRDRRIGPGHITPFKKEHCMLEGRKKAIKRDYINYSVGNTFEKPVYIDEDIQKRVKFFQ